MKQIVSVVLFIVISCSLFSQNTSTKVIGQSKEDFNEFINKFVTDSTFQISRIEFPLEYITLDDDYNEISKTIHKSQWRMDVMFIEYNMIAQIYDNFNMELRDTDERVFSWQGVDNGIRVNYFFKRTNGLWYLVKLEDTST